MSSVTLTLAVIGTVTGVASLVWNIIRWHRAQPRVKVTAHLGSDGDDKVIVLRAVNPAETRIHIKAVGFRLHNNKFLTCDLNTCKHWRCHHGMPVWVEPHDAFDVGLTPSLFFDLLDDINPGETNPSPYALDMTDKWFIGKTTKGDLRDWRRALSEATVPGP